MADKPKILHLSGDFPDPIMPHKTHAISRLVELTSDIFEHRVISLNRVMPSVMQMAHIASAIGNPASLLERETSFAHGAAFTYAAPPKGVFHQTALKRVSDALLAWMQTGPWKSWRPDLVVGHKLTIEGIIAQRMALDFGIPYALSIQGNTDTRIVSVRPDLSSDWRALFHQAKVVFPFAPWTLDRIEERFGKRLGVTVLLPCATALDTPLAPTIGAGGLVSAFHLQGHKWKNLHGMAHAVKHLRQAGSKVELAVIGGGPEAFTRRLKARYRPGEGIRFEGPLNANDMPCRLNNASGFVLPSLRDSFGMVFVEALFAGTPIVYPARRAVDGYFDTAPFAIRVDPEDTPAIAQGMRDVLSGSARMKAALQDWQHSEHATRFTRAGIARAFADGLRQALRSQ